MYGLEAINAHNGWAQALAGACIVMTGLAVLSFLISQLHKVIGLFEQKAEERLPATTEKPAEETFPELCPSDLQEAAGRYKSISKTLGDHFALPDLYKLCLTHNVPHPHLTIKCFRETGILIPADEGTFTWK